MINYYFSYISHYVRSNVVYFIIYLISRQHNSTIQNLKFIFFRASNEREIRFIFSFLRPSAVSKRLIYLFHVYFINAFNCDFFVKFVHNSYSLLLTFVMYAIIIIFLIASIIFSYAVDNISDSQRCIFSHNKELNST